MKKALMYLIVFCLVYNVFMINSSVFSYDYVDKSNEYFVELLKSEIYDITEEYYRLYGAKSDTNSIGIFSGTLCPNGITVKGYGTLSLEDYVAGVIQHEAYTHEGIEALKAQAIAARTYAVNSTDYCKRPIENSTASQTFSSMPGPEAKAAAQATSGMILTYNGKIFSSQYDSFCFKDGDCPDSTNHGGSYTVTYTKLPSGERHTITLSDQGQFSRITTGQGHARGMSQLVSYQMAKEGKSYDEILRYFYSTGIEIVKPSSATNWKQCDSAWGNIKLGSVDGTSLCEIGCYVTSIAILISQSGASTTLGDSFNPGTFAQYLISHNAFSAGGALNSLTSVYSLVSGFSVGNPDYNTSVDNIRSYLSSGKYVQIHIKRPNGTQHFIAVTGVEGDKVHISDPGNSCTVLSDCYPSSYLSDLRIYTIG